MNRIVIRLGLVAVGLLVGACAAGSSPTDGSGGQGGVSWSTSSIVGQGGAGGNADSSSSASDSTSVSSAVGSGGQGGQGGAGDVASSSSSTSSSTASSGSGGAPPVERALLLAGGSASFVGATLEGGQWTTKTFGGGTNRGIGLGLVSDALAIGVVRDATTGALTFVKHDGADWSAAAGVAMGVTTQASPALAIRGIAVDVVFHGYDFKHYFASYSGAWTPTAEQVKPAGQDQSFGPTAGAVAGVGQELALAFPGGDGKLYHQSRTLGVWKSAAAHEGTDSELMPALVALDQGAELLLVYIRKSDKKLMFATRKAGAWSAPMVLEANSFSNDPPSVTALPGGEAMVVFRGTDGKPYASRYEPSKSPAWSTPKPIAAVNPSVVSVPSVARGIEGHLAELAYVGTDGKAYQVSFDGSSWSAPVSVVGPGLVHVALATTP
jgi:hypothetical protein